MAKTSKTKGTKGTKRKAVKKAESAKSEKSKKLTSRAFQAAYEQYHPEETVAAQAKPRKPTPVKSAKGKVKRAPIKKKVPALSESKTMTTEEVTLTAFRLIYESYHPESHA